MKLELKEILKRPINDLPLVKKLIKCAADATVEEVSKILQGSSGGSVVIAQDGKTVGIFTERDVLKKVLFAAMDPKTTKISTIMTPNPVSMRRHEPLGQVLLKMKKGGFRHLVISDAYDVADGIISMRDIMDYLTDAIAEHL